MKKNFLLFVIVLAVHINSFCQNVPTCENNLIVNGNFEAGYTGFTTGYTVNHNVQIGEGEYEVEVVPHHGCIFGPDHTPTGPGYGMYVNGSQVNNTIVWTQNISVTPNTNYSLSAWIKGQCFNTSPAIIQFSINGSQVGSLFSPTSDIIWEQFSSIWNSGSSTTATLTIIDLNTYPYGNDFGLDDIVLAAPLQIGSATAGNASCSNTSDGKVIISAKAGVAPYQYSINNGTTYSAGANPYTFTGLSAGTYTVKVKDNCGNESNAQIVAVGNAGVVTSCSITATPSNTTYTGGVPTNIYLGYGPQSVTLKVNTTGTPTGYTWSGNGTLSCTNCSAPVFTPTVAGVYNFTVLVTNSTGCNSTCNITICVLDIQDNEGSKGNKNDKKVFICHVPPGNPGNAHTLSISTNAVPAHINLHGGDRLGKCEQVPCGTNVPVANNSIFLPVVSSEKTNADGKPPLLNYTAGVLTGEIISTDINDGTKVSISPNPNKGLFILRLNNMKGSKAEITILDAKGAIVEKRNVRLNLKENNIPFDLSGKLSGICYIKIVGDEVVKTEKIIIQR